MCFAFTLVVLHLLLQTPQVESGTGTIEGTMKAQNSGESWGMCSKHSDPLRSHVASLTVWPSHAPPALSSGPGTGPAGRRQCRRHPEAPPGRYSLALYGCLRPTRRGSAAHTPSAHPPALCLLQVCADQAAARQQSRFSPVAASGLKLPCAACWRVNDRRCRPACSTMQVNPWDSMSSSLDSASGQCSLSTMDNAHQC